MTISSLRSTRMPKRKGTYPDTEEELDAAVSDESEHGAEELNAEYDESEL